MVFGGCIPPVVSAVVVAGLAYGQDASAGTASRRARSWRPPTRRTRQASAKWAMLGLLRLEQVQKELNLTDEQKESVKKLAARNASASEERGARARPGRVERRCRNAWRNGPRRSTRNSPKSSSPSKWSAYKQIRIQVQGPAAFATPEVVKGPPDYRRAEEEAKDNSR